MFRSFSSDDRDRHHDEITTEQELITTTETVKPVLRIVPDGRSPRVKSNILKQGTNRKHHQKKKFKGSGRRKFGRSLDLGGDSINEIDTDTVDQEEFDVDFEDDVFDNIDNNDDDEEYTEPEVRPDGRKPRIKSNILAKKSMNGDNNHKRFGSKKQKNSKSGFRHSKKVAKTDTSFRSLDDDETPADNLDIDDGADNNNAITTFRPIISLEHLVNTNETLPLVSPPQDDSLSVPLPNFEPAFSDMTNNSDSRHHHRDSLQPSNLPQSVTEIVRVSSKDKNLFNSDYSYYDYYDEFFNSK